MPQFRKSTRQLGSHGVSVSGERQVPLKVEPIAMTPDASPSKLDDAARWFARLQGDASEQDWLAFTAWLESAPDNKAAYDAVEAAWIDADGGEAETAPPWSHARPAQRTRRNVGWWAAGIGAMAATVAFVLWTSGMFAPGVPAAMQAFRTDAAHTQLVSLDDGSRLSVQLSGERRDVTLEEGEASFDVAPDKSRPFYVAAGPRTIHVTGTEFNVVRHAASTILTVRRGSVAVEDTDGRALAMVSPGMQVALTDDAAAVVAVNTNADDAFAWKDGRLVYSDTPLQRVSDDLSRYFDKPVRVAPEAAAITVSGVLQIDTEEAMLRRLMLFAPISAKVSADGIVLYPR